MEDKFLVIDNISVTYYGGYTGVNHAAITIDENSLVCIVGGHNSGKSTLLKAIGGLEKLSGGNIYYKGAELNKIPIAKRNFSLTFGEGSLFNRKTVEFNLAYPMRIRKSYTKEQIAHRVATVAKAWGLEQCLLTRVGMLDNVSKASLLIARSLVIERDLYMLDNPLSNIGGASRGELLIALSKSLRELNSTIIYATDRIEESAVLSPDIYAIISNGVMADYGTLHSIYRDPSSLSVARIVSSNYINVIESNVNSGIIKLQNIEINISDKLMANVFSRVIIAFYPQDVVVNIKGRYSGIVADRQDYNRISKLKVNFAESIIYVEVDYNDKHIVNDSIHFDINNDTILLFDVMSELSIIKHKEINKEKHE